MPEKKSIELLPKNEKYTIGTNNNLKYLKVTSLKLTNEIKGNLNDNINNNINGNINKNFTN